MAAIGVRAGLPSAHSMKALCKGSVATRSRVQRPEVAWAYPWRRPKPGARAPPLAPAGMIRRRIPVVEPSRGGDECSRRRFDTGRPEMIQFTFTFTFICHRADTINLLTRCILYSLRHGGEPGHTRFTYLSSGPEHDPPGPNRDLSKQPRKQLHRKRKLSACSRAKLYNIDPSKLSVREYYMRYEMF